MRGGFRSLKGSWKAREGKGRSEEDGSGFRRVTEDQNRFKRGKGTKKINTSQRVFEIVKEGSERTIEESRRIANDQGESRRAK